MPTHLIVPLYSKPVRIWLDSPFIISEISRNILDGEDGAVEKNMSPEVSRDSLLYLVCWSRGEQIFYTVKKAIDFPVPAGMSLIKLSMAGNTLIIPGQRGWVSDMPAGDGKISNLFLQWRGHDLKFIRNT
jgi:hypothetical protein